MGATLTEAVAGVDGGAGGKRPWLSGVEEVVFGRETGGCRGRAAYSGGRLFGPCRVWAEKREGGRQSKRPFVPPLAERAWTQAYGSVSKGDGKRDEAVDDGSSVYRSGRVGSATLTGTSL